MVIPKIDYKWVKNRNIHNRKIRNDIRINKKSMRQKVGKIESQ